MTIGIYKLNFSGTDKVYVGQSSQIEIRLHQHIRNLKNNTANYKLLVAYKEFGIPSIEVICECCIEELDITEKEAIEIFNAVDNGFNIYKDANSAPSKKGVEAGNAKYSKEQILHTFNLLVDYPEKSFKDISILTKVSHSVICKISCLALHSWLEQDFPDKYRVLRSLVHNRAKPEIVSYKLSAKNRGIIYPKIKDPSGIVYYIENATKFAKEYGLAANHLIEVLNGQRKSHKGWKICLPEVL